MLLSMPYAKPLRSVQSSSLQRKEVMRRYFLSKSLWKACRNYSYDRDFSRSSLPRHKRYPQLHLWMEGNYRPGRARTARCSEVGPAPADHEHLHVCGIPRSGRKLSHEQRIQVPTCNTDEKFSPGLDAIHGKEHGGSACGGRQKIGCRQGRQPVPALMHSPPPGAVHSSTSVMDVRIVGEGMVSFLRVEPLTEARQPAGTSLCGARFSSSTV